GHGHGQGSGQPALVVRGQRDPEDQSGQPRQLRHHALGGAPPPPGAESQRQPTGHRDREPHPGNVPTGPRGHRRGRSPRRHGRDPTTDAPQPPPPGGAHPHHGPPAHH